ncbi:MAG: protein kinase domain-containing protein [Kofleriaceae bacterium]
MGQLDDDPVIVHHPEGTEAGAFAARGFAARYQRTRALGVGGMGEVHAWRDRATGREVAIKTIRSDRHDAVVAQRFAREARVQAQLEHPSIVPVYDVGVDEGGELYFTMKRVRGDSLASVLRDGRYSLRKLLTVLARVAMTLEYAHCRGVVNRDLKPSNIMLGAFDEVYVIDWGLATLRAPDAPPAEPPRDLSARSDLIRPLLDSTVVPETFSGQLIGTPGYIAPEQIQSPDLVDGRSDVYALGVILFEILTGERLHRGETLADVLLSTLETDGASPAQRAPAREIPPELEALCRAATALSPGDRPARAAEVARTIEAYLDGNRDLERRRELAAEAAGAATRALEASRAPGAPELEEELRATAMREVGRALALDPDNLAARVALIRSLTEPTRSVPRAAEAALQTVALRSVRVTARNGALALLGYPLYVPLVVWMGLREPWMLGAMAGAISLLILATYQVYRRPLLRLPWWHVLASSAAMLCGVGLFGSLVLIPMLVFVTAVAYISTVGRSAIWYVVPAVGVIVGPLILQLAGVLPPSYELTDGTIRILPLMAELPELPSLVLLIATHVMLVVTGVVFVWRTRCAHLATERQLALQAWHLGQLVPPDARPALDGAGAPITA